MKLLFYFFLLLILVYYIYIWVNKVKIIPTKVIGRRYDGLGMARQFNFPTVNMSLDNPVPCGFYLADTDYGKITMLVGKKNPYNAECNFHNYIDEIVKQESIIITNIKKVHLNGDFLDTYYKGCSYF